MRTGQADSVLSYVRRLADTTGAASDQQLLDRFVRCRDAAAFAALLRRHGPMVLGVCRRILGNSHDAEDAFQTTFLVLAQKAHSLGRAGSAAGWLYRVAYRAALRIRALDASRRRHERSRAATPGSDPLAEVSGRELLAVLDEELQRLPERQRLPLLLCYLQAHTCEEAARQLGLAPRTFKRRLQEARQCLRRRLERRGLQLSAALLAAGVTEGAVTPDLAAATLAAVARDGAASAAGVSLQGVLSAGRLKIVAGLCLAVGVLAAGGGLYCQRGAAPEVPAAVRREPAAEAVRVDGQGDPLPEGALLRLGNVRFLHEGIVRAVAYSADGKLLATGADDHVIRLWEADSGKEVRRMRGRLDMIHALAFSPDGKRLASGGEDRLVRLWNVDTGSEAGQLAGHGKEVRALAFSPDGARLASAGSDETVRLWDVAAGKEVGRCRANHGWGSPLRFLADGARLAVGGADGSVVVWDSRSPKEPWRLVADAGGVGDFALSPDGRLLASGGEDANALVWDVAGRLCGPLPERLSEAERLRLGADLGHPDAACAYRAMALLAELPREALPLLRERLRSLRAEEERHKERIPRLLAELDSDRFEERQKASAELEKMGRWAEPALRKALAGDLSPEARRRIEALLKKLQPWSLPPDGLVILRSLQVLEQIGSAEAVTMLKELAEQLEDGRVRREAHASCGRLGR